MHKYFNVTTIMRYFIRLMIENIIIYLCYIFMNFIMISQN